MSSDEVQAVLATGDVFFLDVRDARELAKLGTFEGYVIFPKEPPQRR